MGWRLEHAYADEVKVFRDCTTVLFASFGIFERSDKGGLAIVDPAHVSVSDRGHKKKGICTHHLTLCAPLSRATFTVVHEKRTSLGKPKVGSTEFLSQLCVLGSKQLKSEVCSG